VRDQLPVNLVPVDDDLALRAALMAGITRSAGLSLGDRVCLALAQRSGQPALTADQAWSRVAEATGARVQQIR
jgi:PIN domain nuclease of toxin-antitoxin system